MAPGEASIRILGPLEVTGPDGPVPLGGLKAKAVLALLALHRERPVSIDDIIALLWRDAPPATAANAVQVYIAAVRKVLSHLDAVSVQTLPGGYVLHADPSVVDRDRFLNHIGDAHRALVDSDRATAAVAYERALAEPQGPALFGLHDFDALRIAGSVLDETELSVFEEHCANESLLGRGALMLPELEQRARRHPFREDLWYLLSLELYRANRQTAALGALRSIRSALVDQLGVDPGARLQNLERRILQHDPTLAESKAVSDETSSWTVSAHPPEVRGAHLLDARGTAVPLAAAVLVGRGATCDLVLDHRHVSAEHARITLAGRDYVLEDLGSKNGTTVNEENVQRHTLRDGDRIGFGGVTFRFRTHSGPPALR